MDQLMAKQTISIIDYAAVAQFAEMRGTHITALTIEPLIVVDRNYHEAVATFRGLAETQDAVLNIEESESEVLVREGDVVVVHTYHCIRGIAVRASVRAQRDRPGKSS